MEIRRNITLVIIATEKGLNYEIYFPPSELWKSIFTPMMRVFDHGSILKHLINIYIQTKGKLETPESELYPCEVIEIHKINKDNLMISLTIALTEKSETQVTLKADEKGNIIGNFKHLSVKDDIMVSFTKEMVREITIRLITAIKLVPAALN